MCAEFINLTMENLADEHLCCIIRSKKKHPGVEAKRLWLQQRLKEGHTFRKLNKKATVFIEYAPLASAWVPIRGENYMYIYCLWVESKEKGNGYGKALLGIAFRMLKRKENPVSVCLEQLSKKLGYQIKVLPRNMVSRLSILPMHMNCWLSPLMERFLTLMRPLRNSRLKIPY